MLDSPKVDLKSIDSFGDKATWDLICSGKTKGVFQLESKLGQNWAKKAKPRNIEELSDLIAIIRPATLDTIIDGKSAAKHYVDRKAGKAEPEYIHPSLEPILKNTQAIIIFQESCIRIAMEIAGFSEVEADALRKIIGKKLSAGMIEMRGKFIERAVEKGIVNREEAEKIFSQIESASRYGFNKSVLDSTKVQCTDGEKEIKDLKIGEYIKAPDDKYVKVLNKYDHGELPVFKVTLANGMFIECTMNHKFMVSNGSILPLHEIIKNDMEICVDD